MRKRRNKKYKTNKKTFIIFIAFIILLSIVGTSYSLLNSKTEIIGKAKIKENLTCKLDLSAEIVEDRGWSNGNENYYVRNIKVTNNGNETIYGWELIIKGPSDLGYSNANAEITKVNESTLSYKNLNWNANIAPGASMELRVTLTSVESTLNLKDVIFNGCSILNGSSEDVQEPEENKELVSFELLPQDYSMTVGEEIPLQIVKNPVDAEATFTWETTNSNVATVSDQGIVSALSSGTIIITAKSNNRKMASTTITVKEIPSSPTDSEEPEVEPEVEVTFAKTNSYNNVIQFEMYMTNNSSQTIRSLSFDLYFPEGTKYTFWENPGVTATGNTFNVNFHSYINFNPGDKVKITGSLELPSGNSPNDFNDIKIINIKY